MNNNRNGSVNDDDTMKPQRKRLRSSEPNLKITVGGGSTGAGGNSEAVEHWYHSSVMATHSNYIDTILATPMQESKTFELSFPDIAPGTWNSMMKFLEVPVEGRLMQAEAVMEVAHAYDQYDFPKGRELCGHVLTEYFKNMKTTPDDLDFLIDAILLADTVNLEEAKNAGVEWLAETLKSTEILSGQTIFSEAHMKKLVPLIVKEELLFQTIKYRCGVRVESKDDVLSHLFPRLIVQGFRSSHMHSLLGSMVPRITLSGCNTDGVFEQHSVYRWVRSAPNDSDRSDMFRITLEQDGWVIGGEDGEQVIEWRCPHSQNLPLPPKVGWKPAHELARGDPRLTY
jgi:hypothetical protein